MHLLNLEDNFMDERGAIRDLVTTHIDAITQITFKAGSIRGNHVHSETTQWTYVVEGSLLMATLQEDLDFKSLEINKGDFLVSLPGEPHAFKAIVDSKILVFTQGPRSGTGYQTDTKFIKVID